MTFIADKYGHQFDKRTGRCIKCRTRYWDVVAEEIKKADAAPPEAQFDNIEAMLEWLDR